MAQAMASMAGLRGSSQAVLEGSLHLGGATRLNATGNARLSLPRPGLLVRAHQQGPSEPEASRRAVLGLVAAGLATGSFVQAVLADAKSIKVGPPPPPSGGLRKFSSFFFFNLNYSLISLFRFDFLYSLQDKRYPFD